MKLLILLNVLFFATSAHSEIYKCKDSNKNISYQQSPCVTSTVGTVRKAADVTEEDRMRAQGRIDAVNEREKQRILIEENNRITRQENLRKLELEKAERLKVELLKRQTIAAERSARANEDRADAAERAVNELRNKSVRCRSDNNGGFFCD